MQVSKTTGKPLQARENYLWELVTERINGVPLDNVNAYAMQWGKDCESFARTAYEVQSGNTIIEAGFIKNIRHPGVGVSLDGMIDDLGAWENKSPKDSTIHIQTWLQGMPEKHVYQVQAGLWITEREWMDFTSFDPRCPNDAQLYTQRLYRDEALIAKMEDAVSVFIKEVEETVAATVAKIKGM
jgi:predicted phage-related endonuclease